MNATGGTGRRRRAAVRALALVAAIAISGAGPAQTRAQAQRAPDAPKRPAATVNGGAQKASGDLVTLNFRDAEIDSVVGAFGHLLDRTFVIDPRVRGKMTLETPRPVTREQAYRLLQSALRSQGFAVVETGALTKVVPEADAKLQSTPVSVGRSPGASGDEVVTQIFRLNYESASNLVPVLRPLISPNNTVVAYPNNNSLVVTDYAANVERIARIIATLDSPSTREVEVIPVQYAVAADIAVAVQRLLEQPAAAGAAVDPGQRVVVMADPRTNSILLRAASPAKVGLAKGLVARLDQPSARPGNINVVYLRNAEAVKLAQTLRGVLGGGEGASSALPGAGLLQQQRTPSLLTQDSVSGQVNAMQPADGAAGAPLQSSQLQPVTVQAAGAIIAADPSTNSLIITAPEPIYRNLRAVIDKLDARRAQVFIESLIVEISAEKAAELGVQWQFLGSPHGSTRVIGGTNLPARGSGANILDAAANIGSIGTGLNLGVVRGTINVPGVGEVLDLGFLARALESGADANILATPNLLTLDNEEARIIIGQNVPFITGQFTATGTGGGAVNPFQTIERRDVGTTLRVRPQVSESGTVRLQIFQEVSSVQDTRLAAGIITNRRAIESNVLVDDGQIIVLGGLIEERIDGAVEKVPGLGDVPVVGQLFRYDSRKRVKTNLLVFLRPVVIRDGNDAYSVTADRYDYIRATRAGASLPQHWALPDFPPTPLSPMPPPPGEAGVRGASPTGDAAPGSTPAQGQSDATGQGALLSPGAATATQAPAPVFVSRPTTVIRTAPSEIVVPLRRPDAPAAADGPVDPLPNR
ncbi:MAG: type II secretion system secretin GspD [Burkholderiaceae bacterium]|nr:type II secretion system secretin GspD [Burkholderiaceae bacterium]